jgi:glycosyltransferase involved in cell wall biosynthesis
MINYIAHWDRILIQSRVEIINELQNYNFRAICPMGKTSKIQDHYSENINWRISKTKFFDINAIFKLKRILDNLEEHSIIHVFTLKSGFFFMIAAYFSKKKFKSTLSITGLGYLFSKRLNTKLIKFLLKPIFVWLINKTFKNIIYQNSSDENLFNKYSKFTNNSYLIESSGLQGNQYLLKEKFNKELKILLAGRLLEDKGIKKYIDLASQMNTDKVKFYLAGELDKGNPKSLTQRDLEEIKNNKYVEYLGYLDIKKELQDYDILISLSDHEGFSRILLEAVYVGLYCIAYKNSGTEFIENFQNTRTVDSKDLELINDVITNVLNTEMNVSLNNRDIIIKKYSTKNIANSFNEIYKLDI